MIKKTMKMFLACMLVCTGILGNVQITQAAEELTKYEIYPKPQDVSYENQEITLSNTLNVVYDSAIDAETKARMQEVANILDLKLQENNKAQEGLTNIFVGVKGTKDIASSYIEANYPQNEDLYQKIDAYYLNVNKNNEIVVLGKDSDAAFYGITTLYHVFQQVKNNQVRTFTVKDYANVASRGFIEGYYGNPWSTQDRINLMTWSGYYKLNSYFYAPKDDPKHNAKWRELYSQEEIDTKIKPLAEAGNKSKTRFVYALHPYMNNPIRYDSDEHYSEDLKIMQNKFEQVIKAGVRQIAILADDAKNVGGENYIKTLEDMTAWLKKMQETYPDLKLTLPFCTQEYMYNGEEYYKRFPENVQIVMTGGKIWGEVSQSFTDTFTSKAGRGPYMWINWPCTDNSKKHLIMGGYSNFLHPKVNPENIQGIVLNPMQQSEPSKVAIFGNAAYSWNMWDSKEEADQIWNDAFKYVDHNGPYETDASNALRELSKHMINQAMDGRVVALDESIELRERLTEVKDLLSVDASIDVAKIDDLIREFEVLQNAAKVYRQQAGDKNIRDQIVYWLNCWDDTTEAALAYLTAIKELNTGNDSSVILENFSKGQAAFTKSKTYGFNYVDHLEYAEVGVQHIVPFIKEMESYLSIKVSTMVDPTKQIITPITNRTDTPSSPMQNMLDDSDTTYTQWKTPNSAKAGDYIGVTYTQPITMNEVKFLMSDSATNNKNTFAKAKLQYTEDGKEWKDIEGTEKGNKALEFSVSDLDLQMKGIRIICTQDTPDIWLSIRGIYINGKAIQQVEGYNLKLIRTNEYKIYNGNGEDRLLDDKDDTFVWYQTRTGDMSLADDYVGFDLRKVYPIDNVRFIMGYEGDFWSNYALEYSVDGKTYTEFKSYEQSENKKIVEENFDGIEARYVRLRNKEDKHTWLKMADFKVSIIEEGDKVFTNSDELQNLTMELNDDRAAIENCENITLQTGEFIGVMLPRIRDIQKITANLVNADDIALEISDNNVEWNAYSANKKNNDKVTARYIRLINHSNHAVTFSINKLEVLSNEIYAPYLKESTFGIQPGWGESEDSRNNGAAFDGNVDTTTEFGTLPNKGEYAIYDLGQKRNISKLEILCQDSAVNYLRDGEISISNDLENWTKVITIGDGVENKNDAAVKCIDSDAGYKANSTYPNKVSIAGTLKQPQTARYLKIEATASNENRAIVFNEIFINDGEYVPTENNPSFTSNTIEAQGFGPNNMFDGNLTTSYKPADGKAGYISYKLSENLGVKKLNIVQSGTPSHAKVMGLVGNAEEKEWVQLGMLDTAFTEIYLPFWDNLFEVKFEWEENHAPQISEIILLTDKKYGTDHTALDEFIKSLDVKEEDYTIASYRVFKEALDNAQAINADNNSTQTELDTALEELETAFYKLVKAGNLTLIKEELDSIANLHKEDYTEDSYAALIEVVKEAEQLLKKADVTEAEVTEMVEKLQASKASLVKKVQVSKDLLNQYIEDNKLDELDLSLYMSDTAEIFNKALKAAHGILNVENATLEQVENAYTQLQNARAGLVLKATKEQVQSLMDWIASYKETAYTQTSWKKFANVCAEVMKELEGEVSQTRLAELRSDVETAAKSLVKAADKTIVEGLLDYVYGLDKNKCTLESYNKLIETADKIAEQLKNGDLTQEEVDMLKAHLEKAIAELEAAKPDEDKNNAEDETGNKDSVSTGVQNTVMPFAFLSMLSFASFVVLSKKRKEN